jgi:MFS family permease
MNRPEGYIGVLVPTEERGRRWLNTFRALRHRNFRIFWLGQVFSLTGNWMQQVGQGWLVYRLTGSPLMLGAVGLVAMIPVLPISLLGGVIIDRTPKRWLLFLTQSALAMCALGLALVTWSGKVQVWHVIIVSCLNGAIGSVDLPARQTFVVDLVGKDDLMNAIALTTSIFNVTRVVGPALAGLLVGWQGEASCFFLNALSFVPFIVGLLFMRLSVPAAPPDRPSLTGGLVQGFKYLQGQPVILVLMSMMVVSSFTVLPYQTLMPVFAQDVLDAGPQGLGFLMAAIGIGAIAGALFVANLDAGRRGSFLTVGALLLPLSIIAFCMSRRFPLALVVLVVAGAATTWVQSMLNTLVQLNVQDDMRGRIMSLYLLLSVGMLQAGGVQVGYVAEHVGISLSLGLSAVACLFYFLFVTWRLPFVRRLG